MNTQLQQVILAALSLAIAPALFAQSPDISNPFGSNLLAQTAATSDPFGAKLLAQTPAASDPFAAKRTDHAAPAFGHEHATPGQKRECLSYTYEAFSLPLAAAGDLQRKKPSDAELYAALVQTGKLERLTILRSEQGNRAVTESISEYRYPTEFRIEDRFSHKGAADAPTGKDREAERGNERQMVPANFETRNTGDTIEIESTPDQNPSIVQLNVAIQHVALAKTQTFGEGRLSSEQPQFETQKISTSITATIGQPRLLATMNPPFGNGVTQRPEQNIWFAFITLKPINTPGGK